MAERAGKTKRQALIAQLLRDEAIPSQAALARRLSAMGCPATQATLSRDLEELGAVRMRRGEGGGLAYMLPGETPAPSDAPLRRVMAEWVLSVEPAGGMLVFRTPPGCAHLIGVALDANPPAEIAGTIAGDDTLFAAVRDGVSPKSLAARMRAMAQLTDHGPRAS